VRSNSLLKHFKQKLFRKEVHTTTGDFSAYVIFTILITLSCSVTIQLYTFGHMQLLQLFEVIFAWTCVNMYLSSLGSLHTDVVSLTPCMIDLMSCQGTYSFRLVISILLSC